MPTTVDIESQRMLLGTTPVRKIYQGTNLLGTRIAELFANGEQGVWFDPSDLSTLFQDAAGTLPVTGVEQPVGLMLDKSKGLALGPELISNGDFNNGTTKWTLGTGWSISSGAAVGTNVTGNLLQSNVALSPVGKTYRVALTISNRTTGNIIPQIGSSSLSLSANGTYTFYLRPSVNDATFYIPASNFTGSIDNISVRELHGNHASQPTTTARPILSARYNLLVSTEDCNHGWDLASNVSGSNVTCPDGRPGILIAKTNTIKNAHARQGLGNAIVGARYSYQVAIYAGSTNSVSVGIGAANDGSGVWGDTNTSVQKISGPGSVSGASGMCLVTGLSSTTPTVVRVERTYISSVSASVYMYPGTHNSSTEGHSVIAQDIDCRLAHDRVNLPAYQRVGNIATNPADYDTTGFPYYLQFDGVDDHLSIPRLDFSGASSAVAVIGLEKLSDAASASPYTHGEGMLTGAFLFLAPANPGQASLRAAVRSADGTLSQTTGADDKPAPIKTVMLASYGNGESTTIRFNGSDTRVASGGPLAGLVLPNARTIVGARVVSDTTQSNFFVGRISGLLHIGRSLNAGERRAVEQFINTNTRAY